MRRLLLVTAGLAAAGFAAWKLRGEPWYREWGHDPDELTSHLPGDDLIPDPSAIDTRGIDIAASPEAVWPWLAQMGFGRGGWYSYDAMDMRGASAARIEPEWQTIAVGDVVATHPGGGAIVKHVDPGKSLVLWLDRETLERQAAEAEAAGEEGTPTNLRATGAMLDRGMAKDFEVSWAFVLEPRDEGRSTRLTERFRIRMEGGGTGVAAVAPLMGFGMFVMMRKQLLGIRDRAEGRMSEEAPSAEPSPA